MTHPSRRRILSWGCALGTLLPGAARAFQVQPVEPRSRMGLALQGRCGGTGEHTDILARLRAQLAAAPDRASATATCPLCGCPVTAWR